MGRIIEEAPRGARPDGTLVEWIDAFEQRPRARASRFSQVARIHPFVGVDGAALATAAGATLTALIAAVLAWTRLGIYAPAFGALRKR